MPLPRPIFHHLCSARSSWGSSLPPFSRPGSYLNSLSVLALGRGKTHWMARPVPRVGGRDNRSTSAPSGCSTHLPPAQGTYVSKNMSWHLGKQSSRGWVQLRGKVPTPCLKGWKISSLLVRWCCFCGKFSWHHSSPCSEWVALMCTHLLLYIHCLHFCRIQKNRKNGQGREIKIDLPCWLHNGIVNIKALLQVLQIWLRTRRAPSCWHLTCAKQTDSPKQQLPMLQCWFL